MSNGEPEDAQPTRRVLRPLELLRVLVEQEVEFVVIGGFSLAAYGYQRATKDIDIVPAPQADNLERLMSALESIDVRPLEADDFRPEEMPLPFNVDGLLEGGNWALHTAFGRIDVMQHVVGVESYETLRRGAEPRDLPDVGRVWFAGREDLIAMKEAAGRPEDLIDVERLKQGGR